MEEKTSKIEILYKCRVILTYTKEDFGTKKGLENILDVLFNSWIDGTEILKIGDIIIDFTQIASIRLV